jgi:hypothetical protein
VVAARDSPGACHLLSSGTGHAHQCATLRIAALGGATHIHDPEAPVIEAADAVHLWGDVDLAGGWSPCGRQDGRGRRELKIRAVLRDVVLAHKAQASNIGPDAYVFGTAQGKHPHVLRRAFASLLYAIGETSPVVMAELGHTDPALALSIDAHAMRRDDGENGRLRVLVDGVELGGLVTSHQSEAGIVQRVAQCRRRNPALPAGPSLIRPEGFEPSTSASGGQRSIH